MEYLASDSSDLYIWPALAGGGEGSFGKSEWESSSELTAGSPEHVFGERFEDEAPFFSSPSSQLIHCTIDAKMPTVDEQLSDFFSAVAGQDSYVYFESGEVEANSHVPLDAIAGSLYDFRAQANDIATYSWPAPEQICAQKDSTSDFNNDDFEHLLAQLLQASDFPLPVPEYPREIKMPAAATSALCAESGISQIIKPEIKAPSPVKSAPGPVVSFPKPALPVPRHTQKRKAPTVSIKFSSTQKSKESSPTVSIISSSSSSSGPSSRTPKKITPRKRQQNKNAASRYRSKKQQQEDQKFADHQELLKERNEILANNTLLRSDVRHALALLERKVNKLTK